MPTILNADRSPPIRLADADKEFVVFLVDDDHAVLESLTGLLRTASYRTKAYSSSEKFLAEHDASVPGCVVLDFFIPELNGLNVQKALAHQEIERPIIFLTGHGTVRTTVLAMRAGAVDVLLKPVKRSELLDAIRRAQVRDEANRRAEAERRSIDALMQRLTPREKEVLTHVVTGECNRKIAETLGITVRTVKEHRGRVMEKMEAPNVAELVRMAAKASLQPYKFVISSHREVRNIGDRMPNLASRSA